MGRDFTGALLGEPVASGGPGSVGADDGNSKDCGNGVGRLVGSLDGGDNVGAEEGLFDADDKVGADEGKAKCCGNKLAGRRLGIRLGMDVGAGRGPADVSPTVCVGVSVGEIERKDIGNFLLGAKECCCCNGAVVVGFGVACGNKVFCRNGVVEGIGFTRGALEGDDVILILGAAVGNGSGPASVLPTVGVGATECCCFRGRIVGRIVAASENASVGAAEG